MDNLAAIYQRQERLELSVPDNATIVGVGGVGTWVALGLAMSGVPNLYLFDHDVMEESNRNRLPFCAGSLGKPKVEAIRDFIWAIRPEANVVAVQAKLEGVILDLQMRLSSLLIDCTDHLRSQLALAKACREHGIRYIRAGYDGLHFTVTGGIPNWFNLESPAVQAEALDDTHYHFDSSWVAVCWMVAAQVLAKVMKYPDKEVSTDLESIGVNVQVEHPPALTRRCRR